MSKRMLCVGKVEGGRVVITRPTLEERMAAQAERNAEVLRMNADLDAILARPQRSWLPATDEDDEAIEADHDWIRWGC